MFKYSFWVHGLNNCAVPSSFFITDPQRSKFLPSKNQRTGLGSLGELNLCVSRHVVANLHLERLMLKTTEANTYVLKPTTPFNLMEHQTWLMKSSRLVVVKERSVQHTNSWYWSRPRLQPKTVAHVY